MNTEVSVTPMDLLHIIEGRSRQISMYAANPPQNFSVDELMRAITGLYAHADTLKNLVEAMNAGKPAAGAEAN